MLRKVGGANHHFCLQVGLLDVLVVQCILSCPEVEIRRATNIGYRDNLVPVFHKLDRLPAQQIQLRMISGALQRNFAKMRLLASLHVSVHTFHLFACNKLENDKRIVLKFDTENFQLK
jgi:hypothetical protein